MRKKIKPQINIDRSDVVIVVISFAFSSIFAALLSYASIDDPLYLLLLSTGVGAIVSTFTLYSKNNLLAEVTFLPPKDLTSLSLFTVFLCTVTAIISLGVDRVIQFILSKIVAN